MDYDYKVIAPKQGNEIRIAVAGDSVTQGFGGMTDDQLDAQPIEVRLTDQVDGSQEGLQGWPYYLHTLLQKNNQTIDYSIMNFAIRAGTIFHGVHFNAFQDNCRSEQLEKSLPNFVFYAFGAMDQHVKKYTEEQFIDNYVQLIKQTQQMPTKPMVFLMVPIFTCAHPITVIGTPEQQAQFQGPDARLCSQEQSQDLQETILKIASQTGIPRNHVVNAWALMRDPRRTQKGVRDDKNHLNLRGMKEIAQQFFMQMSLSPEYIKKQELIVQGKDASFKQALRDN